MRPDIFGRLLSFDEALALVMATVRPVTRTSVVPLRDASSRVSARDVVARVDVPPFDRAAMDGYAVRAMDLRDAGAGRPVSLRCVGQVFTGQVLERIVGAGECIEIGTGAPLPAGASAVVMVEQTSRTDDQVTVAAAVTAGQNIGRRGADLRLGQGVVARGDVLSPARVGALAAVGATEVEVFDRPSVAILSTGNEITPPGDPLPPGHVYDVNRFTLQAVVDRHGGTAAPHSAVADALGALTTALTTTAASHDIVVCSGGSSVGGRDLLVDAIQACGRIAFHGIAVKPGKPTLFGSIGETPIFGMPGNPTSCLSNAYLLLVPFLRSTARLGAWRPTRITLPLGRRIASASDRHQFFTVTVADGLVHPAFKSSGDITSMAGADGFIEIQAGVAAVEAGTAVTVTLF